MDEWNIGGLDVMLDGDKVTFYAYDTGEHLDLEEVTKLHSLLGELIERMVASKAIINTSKESK